MQSRISSKWSLFTITVVVIVLFLIIVFCVTSSQTLQKNIAFTKQAGLELPIRLKIPKINADAPVEYVGLAPDGSMGVPAGPNNVGWFDLGPRPGNIGSAVIAGHRSEEHT